VGFFKFDEHFQARHRVAFLDDQRRLALKKISEPDGDPFVLERDFRQAVLDDLTTRLVRTQFPSELVQLLGFNAHIPGHDQPLQAVEIFGQFRNCVFAVFSYAWHFCPQK
jgi:hypothetical protein